MNAVTPLFEVTFSETPVVDRDAGVIRGVKILGRTSRNNRVYSDGALNQAAYFYEGLAVNLDHPQHPQASGERSVADGFGWLTSVGVRENGVFGDLHFLRNHPQAAMIAEAAERNPKRFGLSHNAMGRVVEREGQSVVESIERVHSVDIVQNPATCTGLFESEHSPLEKSLNELTLRIERLETEVACRSLLEQCQRTCEPRRLQALIALPSEEARRQLIESWPTQESVQRKRPESSPPLVERATVDHLPDDLSGFVATLRANA